MISTLQWLNTCDPQFHPERYVECLDEVRLQPSFLPTCIESLEIIFLRCNITAPAEHKRCIKILGRGSSHTVILPESYLLNDVIPSDGNPRVTPGFADTFEGRRRSGAMVCIKSPRVNIGDEDTFKQVCDSVRTRAWA
jgi:hypothetical protein